MRRGGGGGGGNRRRPRRWLIYARRLPAFRGLAAQCVSAAGDPATTALRIVGPSPARTTSCARGPTSCISGIAKCPTSIRRYRDPLDYFDLLKTQRDDRVGQRKDQFHFTFDTDDWIALSQSGSRGGLRRAVVILAATPPRRVVVAYVEPGLAGGAARISRAACEVLRSTASTLVNGNTQADRRYAERGPVPRRAGETHTFVHPRAERRASRRHDDVSANVTSHAGAERHDAQHARPGPVGYMLFNDHIATAGAAARSNAINTLTARTSTT